MESGAALRQLLSGSRIALESVTARQITGYLALLEKWNARINLISRTDWGVIGPLFREGIWAARLYPAAAVSHLDIGSGAGFPAILLKIFNPRITLDMVESRGKKGRFLETVADRLELVGVRVHTVRLSDYLEQSRSGPRWDCISWKALKLRANDLLQLHQRGHPATQFWMFHGQEASWEETEEVKRQFALIRKEIVPGRRDSSLSIYRAV